MAHRVENDDTGDPDSKSVAVCVRTLNHTIGQLANQYGAASVVAALTDVVGCSSCADEVSRERRIRALMQRVGLIR